MAGSPGLFKRLLDISLTKVLVIALLLIQFPLWFGSGGWIRVWMLERDVAAKQEENLAREQRIRELEAEVKDLKRNPKAAEERARYELGLIAPGERFLQWGQPKAAAGNAQQGANARSDANAQSGANAQSLSSASKKGAQP
jgi:cell division protein FtsB